MENNIFKDIKAYDYKELDGKTLEIHVSGDDTVTVISGKDINSNKIYILNYEVKKID